MYVPIKRLITVAALTLIACFAFATATQESAMEEPAAFDWLRMYDHSYQDIANEDNPLFLFLEDKFNVDINLVHYHYDVFRQQRDVLVSSGDMADLFAAWDFDLATYGERLVQPYNDRLAAGDLPSFQAVLERNPGRPGHAHRGGRQPVQLPALPRLSVDPQGADPEARPAP